MRRRRDEGDACRGMTGLGDVRIDLFAGQVAAFTGLCALRAFDLDGFGVDEVIAGDAETSRGDLLDLVALIRFEAGRVFAAFTGITHAAEAVHGLGDAFVGFLAESAVAHGAGMEAFDDGIDWFDFFDGDAAASRIFEIEEVTQAEDGAGIDMVGIFLVDLVIICLDGLLQELDRFGIDDMGILAAFMILVVVAPFQRIVAFVGALVAEGIFSGDFLDADAADRRRRADEVLIDDLLADADGFENLGAVVGMDRGNTHLGHDGEDAVDRGLEVIFLGYFIGQLAELLFLDELLDGFQGHVRIDGRDAVADEGAEMVHFTRFARFQDEADVGALALADEVMMECCRSQEGRDGGHAGVDAAVRQDEDIGAVLDGLGSVDA